MKQPPTVTYTCLQLVRSKVAAYIQRTSGRHRVRLRRRVFQLPGYGEGDAGDPSADCNINRVEIERPRCRSGIFLARRHDAGHVARRTRSFPIDDNDELSAVTGLISSLIPLSTAALMKSRAATPASG